MGAGAPLGRPAPQGPAQEVGECRQGRRQDAGLNALVEGPPGRRRGEGGQQVRRRRHGRVKQVKDDEEDLNAHNLKRSAPCGVVMKKMKKVRVESVASVFMVCSAMRCAQQCARVVWKERREKREERRERGEGRREKREGRREKREERREKREERREKREERTH